MVLTADIGNSNIVFAAVSEKKVEFVARVATVLQRTYEEYAVYLKNILFSRRISISKIEGAIISSVSPALSGIIHKAIEKAAGINALLVGPGIKTGLKILVENPAQLGSDRVVDAVAAVNCYNAPVMVIDMGTATTMSVIDESSSFLGGMIVPGIKISVEALAKNTSQLPHIALEKPDYVIGKNTVECMESGLIYGNASLVDGMIQRVEEELGSKVTPVATGGLSKFIVPHCKNKIIYDEHLLLKGLYILFQKNNI
jgi:pantothenate kinase, type III